MAADYERQYIQLGRSLGWPLTNTSDGGDGVDITDPDKLREYLAMKSAASKKMWLDPRYRARLVGNTERRRKIGAATAARWEENRADMLETMNQAERIAAISRSISARNRNDKALHDKVRADWADPEHRAARLRKMAATKASPEWRERFAESLREMWSKPAERERRVAIARDPAVNAKRSASLKAAWARRKAAKQQPA